jgi:hypothetical protein
MRIVVCTVNGHQSRDFLCPCRILVPWQKLIDSSPISGAFASKFATKKADSTVFGT